tara:strand:+ start:588 stop:842 length:255 start_codon:yes stop_codon:yes gene_type:complete
VLARFLSGSLPLRPDRIVRPNRVVRLDLDLSLGLGLFRGLFLGDKLTEFFEVGFPYRRHPPCRSRRRRAKKCAPPKNVLLLEAR